MKSQNPEFGVGDIAKELGRRWAEADSDVKSKYEAMAEKDKARYEKVLNFCGFLKGSQVLKGVDFCLIGNDGIQKEDQSNLACCSCT